MTLQEQVTLKEICVVWAAGCWHLGPAQPRPRHLLMADAASRAVFASALTSPTSGGVQDGPTAPTPCRRHPMKGRRWDPKASRSRRGVGRTVCSQACPLLPSRWVKPPPRPLAVPTPTPPASASLPSTQRCVAAQHVWALSPLVYALG